MELKRIMTTDVCIVAPSASVAAVARMMREKDIGMLPVAEDDRIIGSITDRDITVKATAEGMDPEKTTVGDVMSKSIVYCYEDESLDKATNMMSEKQIRRLPILNRDKRLVGIVSLGDVAKQTTNPLPVGEALAAVSRG